MDFWRKRIFFNIIGSILAVLLVATGFFALVNVVFNITYIKTDVYQMSMYPTLNANVLSNDECGDKVYVNKFASVARGDIVVARVSWNDKPIIKRLVACPNDCFYISDAGENYELFVNEKLFYTMPKVISFPQNGAMVTLSTEGHFVAFKNLVQQYKLSAPERIVKNSSGQEAIKLFANEYLLLGDNWAASEDCLTVLSKGTANEYVKQTDFIGKVDMVVHKGENGYVSLFKQMMELVFKV